MQWWAWIVVGTILLGAELSIVDAQFYLVFLGVSALAVGFLASGLTLAIGLQWLIFTVLAALSLLVFRRRIYERLRRNLPVMKPGPAGATLTMPSALQPGETCRLEHHGSSWSAINAGRSVIEAGGRARIERIDGLTLVVRGDP